MFLYRYFRNLAKYYRAGFVVTASLLSSSGFAEMFPVISTERCLEIAAQTPGFWSSGENKVYEASNTISQFCFVEQTVRFPSQTDECQDGWFTKKYWVDKVSEQVTKSVVISDFVWPCRP